MDRPSVASMVGWLRAGYPEGVPEHDYLPLFALLGQRHDHDEVVAVANELLPATSPESALALWSAVDRVAEVQPAEADLARVRGRLADGGWEPSAG